jgi:hypothetical protein
MDLGEKVVVCGLDSSGSGKRPVAGFCQHTNEPSSSINGEKFLDQLIVLLAYPELLCFL